MSFITPPPPRRGQVAVVPVADDETVLDADGALGALRHHRFVRDQDDGVPALVQLV